MARARQRIWSSIETVKKRMPASFGGARIIVGDQVMIAASSANSNKMSRQIKA